MPCIRWFVTLCEILSAMCFMLRSMIYHWSKRFETAEGRARQIAGKKVHMNVEGASFQGIEHCENLTVRKVAVDGCLRCLLWNIQHCFFRLFCIKKHKEDGEQPPSRVSNLPFRFAGTSGAVRLELRWKLPKNTFSDSRDPTVSLGHRRWLWLIVFPTSPSVVHSFACICHLKSSGIVDYRM